MNEAQAGVAVEDRLLSMRDLTAMLKISQPTIWRMVRDGRFPAGLRVSPGLRRWRLSTIQAWLDAQAEV